MVKYAPMMMLKLVKFNLYYSNYMISMVVVSVL